MSDEAQEVMVMTRAMKRTKEEEQTSGDGGIRDDGNSRVKKQVELDIEVKEKNKADEGEDQVKRNFLQIAKIRHNGDWNPAPKAISNLMVSLKDVAKIDVVRQAREIDILSPNFKAHTDVPVTATSDSGRACVIVPRPTVELQLY